MLVAEDGGRWSRGRRSGGSNEHRGGGGEVSEVVCGGVMLGSGS